MPIRGNTDSFSVSKRSFKSINGLYEDLNQPNIRSVSKAMRDAQKTLAHRRKQKFIGADKVGFYSVHHDSCGIVDPQLLQNVFAVRVYGMR